MRINVYLPDEIGQAAKEAELNFSAILRDALIKKLYDKDGKKLGLVQKEDRSPFKDLI